jgi:hypothetical protein
MSTISQITQLQLASATWANGGTLPTTVTQTGSTALATEAADLSAQASAVVSLSGGSSTLSSTTYNAAGLFDSLAAAGTLQGSLPQVGATGSAATTASQNEAELIVSATLGATTSDNSTSNLLTATLGGGAATLDSSWSKVLKENPSLSGAAADSLVNGQIVDTLA